MPPIVIYGAKRTPHGALQGSLATFNGHQLATLVLKDLYHTLGHLPDGVIMGNVLNAGQGQSPCRQAVINAFDTPAISAMNINKVCGSGMQSILCAIDHIRLNPEQVIFAGGFESMSQAPFLLPQQRSGIKMGHGRLIDHMLYDGLEDAYHHHSDGTRFSMGLFADQTADHYGFTRQAQENYVTQSYEFYNAALAAHQQDCVMIEGIPPLDEPSQRVKTDKFPKLKPAFSPTGTVTAATSSSIADGAAAVILGAENSTISLKPLARIVGYASFSGKPAHFTTAPIAAIEKLLQAIQWTVQDVDLFEINEAFAVVPMAVIQELSLDRQKVNIHGGACIMGHPIGATGCRIVVTLLNALARHQLKRGIATMCIGGGESLALAIERID